MTTGKVSSISFKWFWLAVVLALATFSLTIIERVQAAQGDRLGTVDTPVHCSSGIGVSVAFDGTNLYYSCYQDPHLYKVRLPLGSTMRANPSIPIKGTLVATLNTGVSGGLGAMAWDPGRQMLWAGTLSGNRAVYLVNPNNGTATIKFQTPAVPYGFTDGLAYDGSDDTLWFSDDVASIIYHLQTDGTVINTFQVSFPNSGLAVGGTTLFAGSNGQGTIYRLDKGSGQVLGVFASPGGRDEDMECDDTTFAGVNAMWSKDAYNNLVYAFEIPSGSCNTGGATRDLSKVPDYKQFYSEKTSPWGNDIYDWEIVNGVKQARYDSWTISSSGCFITSIVDVMRYWDVTSGIDSSDVNPGTMNNYLSQLGEPDGYQKWGNTNWSGVQKYSGNPVKVSIVSLTPAANQTKEDAINAELVNNQPVIVGVPFQGYLIFLTTGLNYQSDLDRGVLSSGLRQEFEQHKIMLSTDQQIYIKKMASNRWWINDTNPNQNKGKNGYFAVGQPSGALNIYYGDKDGHWVVIYGSKVNGHYPIRDPGSSRVTDLGSYGDADVIGGMVLVKQAYGSIPQQRIAIHSPAELLVTDPLGRREGYDPVSQTYVDEIPGAVYDVEMPIVNQNDGLPQGEPVKFLVLPQPEVGSYVLTVIGTGDGPYTIDFQTIDVDGNFASQSVNGMASSGSKVDYPYAYDGQVISVQVVNQPPSLTIPGDQTVQYSDSLSFGISASDPEASDTLVLSASGLPNGLTFTDNGNRTGAVSGIAQVQAGTYPVTFSVNDGFNPPVMASLSIIVTREDAVVTPSSSNPTSVKVNTASGTAGSITLTAAITEANDDSTYGDISNAQPVSFTLQPVGSGSPIGCTATTSGGGVGGTRTASCTFNNVPVNVYDVHITIGGDYYTGTADAVLAVYDPSLGFTTGGGTVMHNGVLANFGFNVKYLSNGKTQGQLLYIEHRTTGDVVLKSNAMGSLSIVKNSNTSYSAIILGKATLNGVGNYSFQAIATDNGEPGTSDQFGLQVKNPSGKVVTDLTFDPMTLAGGNIQVPHK